jgi:HEPN domain-containing protein
MDIAKQIEYWKTGSEEDLDVAEGLITAKKWRHGLFIAHLALEKMLKAHVTKATRAIAPKIHKLERLAELAALSLSKTQRAFLRSFQIYNIEGRYPDFPAPSIDPETAQQDFTGAKEFIQWLMNQL